MGIIAPTDYRTGARARNILEEKPVTGLKNTGVIMGENTGVAQFSGVIIEENIRWPSKWGNNGLAHCNIGSRHNIVFTNLVETRLKFFGFSRISSSEQKCQVI